MYFASYRIILSLILTFFIFSMFRSELACVCGRWHLFSLFIILSKAVEYYYH